ncbi:MAG: hypothetical protein UU10_C0004G0018 [Parcubacteria group bacterium GW2011_GWF1_40_6]|nr:MAG: hypothetical protein UU10_C0004G0018 [Parcubacteria group bacterium GW2011_GWF1_40_6]
MEFKPEKTSLETVEPNEARKEEVGIGIEKAKKERLTLGKVVLSRLASLAISAIPLAGSIKMGKEIAKNKAIVGGKELKSIDKIMRGVIISSNLIFYVLLGFRFVSEDSEVNKEIHLLMLELTAFTVWLTIAQESIEGKRGVQEVIQEKFKLNFPQFLKNVRQFAEKYDMESLKEPLSVCEKIIEEYGYDNIGNLIVRANDEKLDDNK